MTAKHNNRASNKIPTLFLINGAFATIVHYSVLFVIFDVMSLGSAGVSSLISSVVASFVSFFGNKYFVFQVHHDSLGMQASRFAALYLMVALFHGAFLLIWTDQLGWSYRVGFLLAVSFQVAIGYIGNKYFVFRK